MKIIAKNKKASFDYFLEEKFEAGMVLQGTEVKVLRQGKISFSDAHVVIDSHGEAWAYNIHIPHYDFGNIANHLETRKRKLLLNREEIKHLAHQMKAHRLTLIPTMIYFKNSRVKLEIALAKGKKQYDKRKSEAEKEAKRKIKQGLDY